MGTLFQELTVWDMLWLKDGGVSTNNFIQHSKYILYFHILKLFWPSSTIRLLITFKRGILSIERVSIRLINIPLLKRWSPDKGGYPCVSRLCHGCRSRPQSLNSTHAVWQTTYGSYDVHLGVILRTLSLWAPTGLCEAWGACLLPGPHPCLG